MAQGPKTVCPGPRRAVHSVWWGPQRHGRDKVDFGQIPKGSACHTKERGALLLVMNNQKGLREKVQSEGPIWPEEVFYFSYEVCFNNWN